MYPPLATARIWDKKVYNKKKSDLFTGDPVTCNDISDAYEEYWPTYHKQKKKHNKSYNDTFNSLINDCEQNYENGSPTSSGYSNCVEQVSWAYEAITRDQPQQFLAPVILHRSQDVSRITALTIDYYLGSCWYCCSV